MDKRTLFYWSKLYLEGIKKGDDYKKLSKVITINLLDFEFLAIENYHSSFHLWEDNALQRWLAFLEKDVSQNRLEELSILEPAIKMAEERLSFLSSDPMTIALYRAREDAEHERANLFSSGKEEGIKEGIYQVATALLDVLDDEMIALKTGLTVEEVQQLRK